jgi:hypothetical protein
MYEQNLVLGVYAEDYKANLISFVSVQCETYFTLSFSKFTFPLNNCFWYNVVPNIKMEVFVISMRNFFEQFSYLTSLSGIRKE